MKYIKNNMQHNEMGVIIDCGFYYAWVPIEVFNEFVHTTKYVPTKNIQVSYYDIKKIQSGIDKGFLRYFKFVKNVSTCFVENELKKK